MTQLWWGQLSWWGLRSAGAASPKATVYSAQVHFPVFPGILEISACVCHFSIALCVWPNKTHLWTTFCPRAPFCDLPLLTRMCVTLWMRWPPWGLVLLSAEWKTGSLAGLKWHELRSWTWAPLKGSCIPSYSVSVAFAGPFLCLALIHDRFLIFICQINPRDNITQWHRSRSGRWPCTWPLSTASVATPIVWEGCSPMTH